MYGYIVTLVPWVKRQYLHSLHMLFIWEIPLLVRGHWYSFKTQQLVQFMCKTPVLALNPSKFKTISNWPKVKGLQCNHSISIVLRLFLHLYVWDISSRHLMRTQCSPYTQNTSVLQTFDLKMHTFILYYIPTRSGPNKIHRHSLRSCHSQSARCKIDLRTTVRGLTDTRPRSLN